MENQQPGMLEVILKLFEKDFSPSYWEIYIYIYIKIVDSWFAFQLL